MVAAVAVCLAAPAAPAQANDSTAELAAGGLIFVRNDNIEMRSEDLFISAREVRVNYQFFNKSARDVTVLVAFPMPDITIDGPDANIAVPTDDPVNLLGFATIVNGRPVKIEVEQRVFALGIDRTALLRSLGIPLAPHLQSTNHALDKLPRDKWDELMRLGLAEIEEFDAGKGPERHLAARWTLRTTYYWQQTFPAKALTTVAHRYRPAVGATVQTYFADPSNAQEAGFDAFRRKYCIDRTFYAGVYKAKLAAKNESGPPFSEERIEYILRTGANWAGPIGQFRLVVDKGAADNLITFCGEGVKRISPTQFELRRADYLPDRDISILILKRLPQQPQQQQPQPQQQP
jgi:hypothetical protein